VKQQKLIQDIIPAIKKQAKIKSAPKTQFFDLLMIKATKLGQKVTTRGTKRLQRQSRSDIKQPELIADVFSVDKNSDS
jgi:hypothetical protein